MEHKINLIKLDLICCLVLAKQDDNVSVLGNFQMLISLIKFNFMSFSIIDYHGSSIDHISNLENEIQNMEFEFQKRQVL